MAVSNKGEQRDVFTGLMKGFIEVRSVGIRDLGIIGTMHDQRRRQPGGNVVQGGALLVCQSALLWMTL